MGGGWVSHRAPDSRPYTPHTQNVRGNLSECRSKLFVSVAASELIEFRRLVFSGSFWALEIAAAGRGRNSVKEQLQRVAVRQHKLRRPLLEAPTNQIVWFGL